MFKYYKFLILFSLLAFLTPVSAREKKEQDEKMGIVQYAQQFVGNPYVWGGNSLIQGCDCSHFVWNVLKDTGHYDGEYVISDGWAFLGDSVDDIDAAVAGDVIVYPGHVAIYDGEGLLIQALGSQYGITHYRSYDCDYILAIRHFN